MIKDVYVRQGVNIGIRKRIHVVKKHENFVLVIRPEAKFGIRNMVVVKTPVRLNKPNGIMAYAVRMIIKIRKAIVVRVT